MIQNASIGIFVLYRGPIFEEGRDSLRQFSQHWESYLVILISRESLPGASYSKSKSIDVAHFMFRRWKRLFGLKFEGGRSVKEANFKSCLLSRATISIRWIYGAILSDFPASRESYQPSLSGPARQTGLV